MTGQSHHASLKMRVLHRLPIFAFAFHCMEHGHLDHLALLVANILMSVVLAVIIWGYPAFIVVMWSAVVTATLLILAATRG